jgi:DNA-directed RNA polymerase specialized sigma subunit
LDSAQGRVISQLSNALGVVKQQESTTRLFAQVAHRRILLTIERRARIVWTMRYLEGRTPDEVMAALDITHRQYSRLFERATTAINRKLVAYLAGDWCP